MKFGEHITIVYGYKQIKAFFICYNRLDANYAWAYFPEWQDIESVMVSRVKKGWKRSWKN